MSFDARTFTVKPARRAYHVKRSRYCGRCKELCPARRRYCICCHKYVCSLCVDHRYLYQYYICKTCKRHPTTCKKIAPVFRP